MIIAAVFTGFNLENSCDINFGFKRFEQVPVFLTILFSFLAGALITLPFTFGKKRVKAAASVSVKKEKKSKDKEILLPQNPAADEQMLFSSPEGKKSVKEKKPLFSNFKAPRP